MTVDALINWFATIGDFPVIAFILAVIISGIPLFLIMALNASPNAVIKPNISPKKFPIFTKHHLFRIIIFLNI